MLLDVELAQWSSSIRFFKYSNWKFTGYQKICLKGLFFIERLLYCHGFLLTCLVLWHLVFQAIIGNAADVAAKDSAQETLVNVSALLYSLILLPLISGNITVTWVLYILFTFIHLSANYRAVMALNLRTFNRSLLYVVTRL